MLNIVRFSKFRCSAALLGVVLFIGLNPLGAFAGTSIVAKSNPATQRFVPAQASAYSSGAADNAQWVGRTAIGTPLRSGAINSAASDWSKFPLGTRFRVVETGKIYQVDDYGSAMVGKMKVDLFTPSTAQMNKWGVRNVTLEILEWGDRKRSLALLLNRASAKYSHIRKMIAGLRNEV